MHFGAPEESPKDTSLEPRWPPGGNLPLPHFKERRLLCLSSWLGHTSGAASVPPTEPWHYPQGPRVSPTRRRVPAAWWVCITSLSSLPTTQGPASDPSSESKVRGPPRRWRWTPSCFCLSFQRPVKKMTLRKDIQRAMLPIQLSKSWPLVF